MSFFFCYICISVCISSYRIHILRYLISTSLHWPAFYLTILFCLISQKSRNPCSIVEASVYSFKEKIVKFISITKRTWQSPFPRLGKHICFQENWHNSISSLYHLNSCCIFFLWSGWIRKRFCIFRSNPSDNFVEDLIFSWLLFCWLTDSLMPARSSLLCNHLDLLILSRTRAGKLNVYQYFSSMFEIYKYISSITGIILLTYTDGCLIALQMLLLFVLGCKRGTFRLL